MKIDTQQAVLEFFTLVLKLDEAILQRVVTFEGDLHFDYKQNELVFSLGGLHKFLGEVIDIEYSDFQKTIYKGNLNEELSTIGGKVEVHHSTGKITDSFYRLVKIK